MEKNVRKVFTYEHDDDNNDYDDAQHQFPNFLICRPGSPGSVIERSEIEK
jgi:hypothetical protein